MAELAKNLEMSLSREQNWGPWVRRRAGNPQNHTQTCDVCDVSGGVPVQLCVGVTACE